MTEADDSDSAPRDVRALVRFDLFLFTAVATVLVIRSALAVTGYPQVGSGGLHIAHVLWGGLLMAIAIVLVEILPGSKVRARAAFIGGIGFGLFIDEVGKFVTKDVNYFFKPAIAIIYSVFIAFYIVVREFVARRQLTDRRRVALVAGAVADLALGQLSRVDRDRVVATAGRRRRPGAGRPAAAGPERRAAQEPLGRRLDHRPPRPARTQPAEAADQVGVQALVAGRVRDHGGRRRAERDHRDRTAGQGEHARNPARHGTAGRGERGLDRVRRRATCCAVTCRRA